MNGRGDVPAAPKTVHVHSESQRPQVLLAIAVLGVLIICLQLFAYQSERRQLRNNQIQQIQTQINESNERGREFSCAVLDTIPPDNGVVDAFRAKLNCGAYQAPKKSTTSGGKTASKTSTSRSTSAAEASGKSVPTVKTTSATKSKSVPGVTRTTPPSPSAPSTGLPSISACVLIVCIG